MADSSPATAASPLDNTVDVDYDEMTDTNLLLASVRPKSSNKSSLARIFYCTHTAFNYIFHAISQEVDAAGTTVELHEFCSLFEIIFLPNISCTYFC